VKIRAAAVAVLALSAFVTGGARANTLTPCQPRTGTAVDGAVAIACHTAAPVIQAVCSLKVPLCDIRAGARASTSFQCAIEAMCRVLAIVCPHCTSAESADSTAAIPPPCPPRALIEQSGGQTFLVVRDPTKPCSYIVVPVPVSPTAAATR